MRVTRLIVKNFKRLRDTAVPLAPITVLVGGNNSGKTCVLQAGHFAVNLLQTTVAEGDEVIPSEKLRYLPTGDVLDLPHGARLTAETPPIEIEFEFAAEHGVETPAWKVLLTRAEGLTLKVESGGNSEAEALLSDIARPFSIYVPGLAGVPLHEEYRSDAVMAKAIARGDANLFLRNVLLRIHGNAGILERFNARLAEVLPGADLVVNFDSRHDLTIDARIRQQDRQIPIDAVGTGTLQYIQLIAYVLMYRPFLLLLDEPDAHLHPNNQRLIARVLRDIVANGETQIAIATHSRTLLEAFRASEQASFVWMENGTVQADASKEHIDMLMALGALDGGERFYSMTCRCVFLTEDTNHEYLLPLLRSNGIDPAATLIHSYETSSKLHSAFDLAKFIRSIKPMVRVIIHRDRDFMTDDDVAALEDLFNKSKEDVDFFVTEGSDVEHYFTRPEHLSACFGISLDVAKGLVDDVLREKKAPLAIRHVRKLDELKPLYQKLNRVAPKNSEIENGVRMARADAVGKDLVGYVMAAAQSGGNVHNPKAKILCAGATLMCERLTAIGTKIPPAEEAHVA